ncbi:hypothetical protein DOY81_010072, partial [Sarcophaga bullata]
CFLTPENLNMVWLWRLTANVFLTTAQLPESLANLDVSGKLAKRDTEIACLTRKCLINLAIRFYTCALKIKQNTFAWYELALCSYFAADYIPEEAKNHLDMATKACQMAIKEQTNRWQNWNLLGVINMHPVFDNLSLAQHCFIQSLNLEQSAIGYAHWVCKILSDKEKYQLPHYKYAINSMYADTVALDAINWYTIIEESNSSPSAYSFQGFLNERQKLYRPAVKAYAKAAEKAVSNEERDIMYTNLGYVHLKLNEPNEAIVAFNKVTHASFKPIIGLALAYFKAGQHQESYTVYNSVLKTVAGTEDDKAARILVAMASMVYAVSKVKRITKRQSVSMQQPRKALTYLRSRVHIFPQCAELRKVLATFLLDNYGHKRQYYTGHQPNSFKCHQFGTWQQNKKYRISSNCIEDSKTLLIASKALQPVNQQRSLKLIQRAILLYPQNINAWNALLQVH